MSNLQQFASTHASFYNHFNLDRHLNRRQTFKAQRNSALKEWRQLMVAYSPFPDRTTSSVGLFSDALMTARLSSRA